MLIDIVIPILNEEKTLRDQILLLKKHLTKETYAKYEIKLIIADNGSTDRSSEIGASLGVSESDVTYLRLEKRGVGLALKTAWLHSDADVIGFMDLDFATDLSHLSETFQILEQPGIDLVCGSRNLPKSVVTNRKIIRTITSKALNLVLKRVFASRFTDGMCGFKFLKRSQLHKIMKNGIGLDGWFFSTELLIVSEQLGLNICELPIKWHDNRNSKVKIARLSFKYLQDIYKLKLHLLKKSDKSRTLWFSK